MMNRKLYSIVYVTLLAGVVFLSPLYGTANLVNYSQNGKGFTLQDEPVAGTRDTIPPGERENFDEPSYKPYTPDPFKKQEEAPSMVIQPQKVEVEAFKPRLFKVPKTYSGFKIEIEHVSKPLSASHDIFYQHGKLYAEKLEDGTISYMLGDFPTAEEAEDFLTKMLGDRYPKARAVEYEDGKRLY